ncbi:FkbM family methyltransferase [Aquabacterium sp. A7-Y]|uniref:FkbM family methyltransferase n=1 Tax=Aquabacterium sp. A7-Y TaxID=1349605 RepID=UPI00223C8EFA|nr:FkbM family methyltransferase [Aquabacterium sp. A7-Y]MCW7537972.1 FkbM family methyltransferase [Aquabacterium sp. A7-Y]
MGPGELAKSMIRKTFRSAGLDVRRYRPVRTEGDELNAMFQHFGVDLILDVGANTGQYALKVRQGGYRGRIVSFEPLAEAHARLKLNARGDEAWQVHEQCAVGEASGEVDIHVAGNSQSSSILPMLAAHADAAPHSMYVSAQKTAVIPLDAVFEAYANGSRAVFLKIDTQGYEWPVLQGAARSLERVVGVQLELSLVPLYEGQRLWEFFVEDLQQRGFQLWSLLPGFTDPRNGRTLQVDGVFFRRSDA